MSTLERLQRWQRTHEDEGRPRPVRIATLDVPGWSLEIPLTGTRLLERAFAGVAEQPEDREYWMRCRVEAGVFHGACGPRRLADMLTCFLDWAEHGEDAGR